MLKNPTIKILVIVVVIVIILSLGYFAYTKTKKKKTASAGVIDEQAEPSDTSSMYNDEVTTTAQDVAQLSSLQAAASSLNYQLVQATKYIQTLPEDQRSQAQNTITAITASINSYNDKIAQLQSKMNLAAITNSLK